MSFITGSKFWNPGTPGILSSSSSVRQRPPRRAEPEMAWLSIQRYSLPKDNLSFISGGHMVKRDLTFTSCILAFT